MPGFKLFSHFIQRHFDFSQIRSKKWVSKNPFKLDSEYSTYLSPIKCTFGIVKEFWDAHWPYIAACKELGISYKVLSISGSDWLDIVRRSGCDAFLVTPSVQFSVWKEMFDERLRILAKELGKVVFPSIEELWLWESKRRMHYWLKANQIPHPTTWIFYDLNEALNFIKTTPLPIVFKTNMGSGSSGVRIFRDRRRLSRHIDQCFKHGFSTYRRGPHDKEWRSVLLQEWLPEVQEWRIRKIGDSFFGTQKLRRGDFHSGTGVDVWFDPPHKLLDFVRQISIIGKFESMGFDIFETKDGTYLINELQAIFGTNRPYEMLINGDPGRYIYNCDENIWIFEKGIFCQNKCCTLRVARLLQLLGFEVSIPVHNISELGEISMTTYEADRLASRRDYENQKTSSCNTK
jgi:glutathione synthase/RimK-type ligase-like ATP-grasp enzyme